MKSGKYFLNCFLMLIPIFVWNGYFFDVLPEKYTNDNWNDIPLIIAYGENVFRFFIFVSPVFMVLSFKTRSQKFGLALYVLGTILYFSSWAAHIYFPETAWSQSLLGFMAPAYTTIIWLIGIGLIGRHSFFRIPHISRYYIIASICFVIIHSLHPYLVFEKL
jgi:hypothetical protein